MEERHRVCGSEKPATNQLAMLVMVAGDETAACSARSEDAVMTVVSETLARPELFEAYETRCPIIAYISSRNRWAQQTQYRREKAMRTTHDRYMKDTTQVLAHGERIHRSSYQYSHRDWIIEPLHGKYFANAGAGRPAGLNAAFERGLLNCIQDIMAALFALCGMQQSRSCRSACCETFHRRVASIARHHGESFGEALRDCVHANRVREDRAFGVIEGVIDTTDAVFDRIEERRVSAAHRMLAGGLAAQRTRLAREFCVAFHRAA